MIGEARRSEGERLSEVVLQVNAKKQRPLTVANRLAGELQDVPDPFAASCADDQDAPPILGGVFVLIVEANLSLPRI